MNELTDSLTTTGLVATVISLFCALLSLLIARYRKSHAPAQRVNAESAPRPQPMETTLLEPQAQATASVLFKRLGRTSLEEQPAVAGESATAQQHMLWE